MKSSILILFVMWFCATLFAQAPDTMWTRIFGGSGSDVGYSAQQTMDGGYIITGSTESFGAGGSDVWLIKTNANGDTMWTKTYGGTDSDVGYSVQQTLDSGYVITGYTRSLGAGGADVWLIKTDIGGNMLWNKTLGGSGDDIGYSLDKTSDGGYIITGFAELQVVGNYPWLIKTNSSGDTLWTKTKIFGLSHYNSGKSVKQTSDGGYIIAGNWGHAFSRDAGLIKTDANGDTMWTKHFNGKGGPFRWGDVGNSVQQTGDGGYIITGYTGYFNWTGTQYPDLWLIKTDSNGDTLWTKTYSDRLDTTWSGYWEEGKSVEQTSDGGYIITGFTELSGAGNDIWLIRINPNGDTLWTKTFGNSGYDCGYSVQQTNDGGYIIVGSIGNSGDNDVCLIKVAPDVTAIDEMAQAVVSNYRLKQNHPNPFNPTTTIEFSIPQSNFVTLKIYNMLGEEVSTLVSEKLAVGNYKYDWPASGLASGVYLYRIQAGNYIEAKKMILLR